MFTNNPPAAQGQKIYDEKFDRGIGAPAVIVTNADVVDDVIAAASAVEGVSKEPGAVCVQVDYAKLQQLIASGQGGGGAPASVTGCAPPQLQVTPIDGRIVVNALLVDSFDSPAAFDTVERLRDAVHAVPSADALVGGQTATNLDVRDASARDNRVIIPIVLVVIFVVLSLLLRALLAPALLIATVVLSFAATLGVCGWVFTYVFDFAGADQSFPLFAFVFLVALGIDYNIFLMTRVREETLGHGTRRGILRGLSVTGGVITSAGIVLAATFAVLAVLPLVFLAELGFAVAFGVLLDTFLVRTVLVPALSPRHRPEDLVAVEALARPTRGRAANLNRLPSAPEPRIARTPRPSVTSHRRIRAAARPRTPRSTRSWPGSASGARRPSGCVPVR